MFLLLPMMLRGLLPSSPVHAQDTADRLVEVVVEDLNLEPIPEPPGEPGLGESAFPEPPEEFLQEDPVPAADLGEAELSSAGAGFPGDYGDAGGGNTGDANTGDGPAGYGDFPSGYGLGSSAGMGSRGPLFSGIVLGPFFSLEAGKDAAGEYSGTLGVNPLPFWSLQAGFLKGPEDLRLRGQSEVLAGGELWDLGLWIHGQGQEAGTLLAGSLDLRVLTGDMGEGFLKAGGAQGTSLLLEGILGFRLIREGFWTSAGLRLGLEDGNGMWQPVLGFGAGGKELNWYVQWGSRFLEARSRTGLEMDRKSLEERTMNLQNRWETWLRMEGSGGQFALGALVFSDNVSTGDFQGFEVSMEAALGSAEILLSGEPLAGNWSASGGLELPFGQVGVSLYPDNWVLFWKKEWK